MLKRILEPEVMESSEDADEYNDMDHSKVNQAFVAELLAFAESQTEPDEVLELGDVLDLGTGTALIPVELCKQHYACRVMAVDLAASMLDLAVYNLEVHSMTERITLAQVDAKTMGFDNGNFDLVMSNSIIHHIPEPMDCLKQMVRVTCEGGLLFIRDLMRPADLETLQSLVQTYAGEESEYCRRLFGDSLHAALTLEEIRALVVELGFEAETVQATTDRHWTWMAIRPESDE
jgi:ubiquinone/menaquinone biosynthesis C-methylase UbiE